jgi:hypothetical protein
MRVFWASIGCQHPKRQELRKLFCPGKRLLPGLEEPIDHDGGALGSGAAAQPGRFSVHHVGTAIDGYTIGIWKDNFTPKRDSFRINRTISCPEAGAIPTGALARAFAVPVHGDASEQRLLAGECLPGQGDKGENKNGKTLHNFLDSQFRVAELEEAACIRLERLWGNPSYMIRKLLGPWFPKGNTIQREGV